MFSSQWVNRWGSQVIEPDRPCFRLIERRNPSDGLSGWSTYSDASIHNSFTSGSSIPLGNLSLDVSRTPWASKYADVEPVVFVKPAVGKYVSIVGTRKIGSVVRFYFHCSTRNQDGTVVASSAQECIENVYVFGPITTESTEDFGIRIKDGNGDVMFDGGYPILRIDRVVQRSFAASDWLTKINPAVEESSGYFAKSFLSADVASVEMGSRSGTSITGSNFAWALNVPSGVLLTRKIQKLDQKGFWPFIWYESLGYVRFTSAYAWAFDRNLNGRFSPFTHVQDGSWGSYDALNYQWPSIDRTPSSFQVWGLVQSFVGIDTTEYDKYLG